jgi:hypothetical protein
MKPMISVGMAGAKPLQLYLDEGLAYVAVDVPGTGRSEQASGRWSVNAWWVAATTGW